MRSETLFSDLEEADSEDLQKALNPFDLLMLLDERPGYPMCFFLETSFHGLLDIDRLKVAFTNATKRHPRLRSRVKQTSTGWHWAPVTAEFSLIVLQRNTSKQSDDDQFAFRAFRLQHEPGIRGVLFENGDSKYSLVLQVHHSICDGLSGLEFLGDVWSLYHGADPPRLKRPGNRKVEELPSQTNDHSQTPSYVSAAWSFASFLPAKLVAPPRKLLSQTSNRPYHTKRLTKQETKLVQSAAATLGTAVNDLLLSAAMRVLCCWNASHGRPRGAVRINMPVSLRPPGSRDQARNQIGYAFLDRSPVACESAVELAKSMATASRWIQSSGAAAIFLTVLSRLARCPWLLRLLTRLPLSLSTAVISNVGNVQTRMRSRVPRHNGCDCPGNLTITDLVGVPPVRPGTALAVGITCYAGQLSVTALTDPATFSDTETLKLSEMIVSELLAFTEGPAALTKLL